MATLAASVLVPAGLRTTGTSVGEAAGWTAAAPGGDKVPLTGRMVIVRLRTSGTACDVTFNSTVPSNYGDDVNLVAELGATDEQTVVLATDGRWDLGGADKGYAGLSYSAADDLEVAVEVVPG